MRSSIGRNRVHRCVRFAPERLEDRRLLATLTVNTASDTVGPAVPTLSLREAIEVSNGTLAITALSIQAQAQISGALSTPNTIDFDIPGSGVQAILLQSGLPEITSPVTIDGYSQPGSSPNTNPITQADNAVPLIELSHSSGLMISAGNSVVRGLIINLTNSFPLSAGILLESNGGDTIAGNFLGTDPTGTVTMGNAEGIAIGLGAGAGTTIGGLDPADRNLIAGNSEQIESVASVGTVTDVSGLVIEGNFIGTDVTGSTWLNPPSTTTEAMVLSAAGTGLVIGGTTLAARNVIAGAAYIENQTGALIAGNYVGIDLSGTTITSGAFLEITSGSGNTVGGTTSGAGNLIAGGELNLQQTMGDVVQGNWIGTDPTGTMDLEGSYVDGIDLLDSSNNLIGGTTPGAGNTIAFVKADPFGRRQGAVYVEPAEPGENVTGNSILENTIYSNDAAGIWISSNDAPFIPTLTAATASSISGSLSGAPNTTYRLEFFASPQPDPNDPEHIFAFHQGKTFLGTSDVTTGADGSATFTFNSSGTIPLSQILTATATDPAGTTSEFSQGFLQTAAPDLAVTGSVPASTTVGSDLSYTLTVTNNGTADATSVMLTTAIPAGATFVSASGGVTPSQGLLTFTLGNLAAGASSTETIVVTPTAPGTLNITANATEVETDANPADNSFSTSTDVLGPGLDGTVSGDAPQTVTLGQDITYTLTAQFTGSDTLTGAVLTDTLPSDMTFVSATDGATPVDGVLTFALGSALAGGRTATITIVVRPTAAGQLTNQAAIVFSGASGTLSKPAQQTSQVNAVTPTPTPTPTPIPTTTPTPTPSPMIGSVKRFGIHQMPTTVVVTFNEALDPTLAATVSHYQIVGPSGRRIAIDSAIYDATTRTVTLHPHDRISIHRTYHFRVRGVQAMGRTDPTGDSRDGANFGRPGSDYVTTLTWRNLILPAWYLRKHPQRP